MTGRCDVADCPQNGEPERRGWHLNRGIDLGHLLVTLAMLAGFFVWSMRQESRVTTLENSDVHVASALAAIKAEAVAQKTEYREDLREINKKLDRLLEKGR